MEAIDERTKAALDDIAGILADMNVANEEEQGEGKIARLKIHGLLDDTGHICERRGFHTAKLFVIGKKGDSAYENKQSDLDDLINILKALEKNRLPKSEASYIIKKLDAIKTFYTPDPLGEETTNASR